MSNVDKNGTIKKRGTYNIGGKGKTPRKSKLKDGEVLTCIWDIWISGKKLDWNKKNLITSIEITETVDGSDTAKLNISDPDFIFISDNLYLEKNPIKIKMGWANKKTRVIFKGYISHIDISFPDTGIPTLAVTCMDNTYKMDRKEVSKSYKKTTSSKVVRQICKKYGLKCVIEKGYPFKVQDTISQSNQSDIAFLQQLAQNEVYPFTARLVGKTFYYIRKGKMKKTASQTLHYLEYPYDAISFSPSINKVTKDKQKSGSSSTNKKGGSSSSSSSSSGTGTVASSSSGSNNKGGRGSSRSTSSSSSGSMKYDRDKRKWTKT